MFNINISCPVNEISDIFTISSLNTTDFEKRTGIVCVFQYKNIPKVNEMVSIAVYRIAQEALENIVRHSEAQSIVFRLQRTGEGLALTISDDGRGIDREVLKRKLETKTRARRNPWR